MFDTAPPGLWWIDPTRREAEAFYQLLSPNPDPDTGNWSYQLVSEPVLTASGSDRTTPSVRTSQVAVALDGLVYPATTWQILAEADAYGTTGPIRAALYALPQTQYGSFDDIRRALLLMLQVNPEEDRPAGPPKDIH
jgi:hypothetical protein